MNFPALVLHGIPSCMKESFSSIHYPSQHNLILPALPSLKLPLYKSSDIQILHTRFHDKEIQIFLYCQTASQL